eukprot:12443117-Ditylum_brightwellii.AAC.1
MNEVDIFLEQLGHDDLSWDHFVLWLLAGGGAVTGLQALACVGSARRCMTAVPSRNKFSLGCALPFCLLDPSMKVCGCFAL